MTTNKKPYKPLTEFTRTAEGGWKCTVNHTCHGKAMVLVGYGANSADALEDLIDRFTKKD